jgi:hypothetical protein
MTKGVQNKKGTPWIFFLKEGTGKEKKGRGFGRGKRGSNFSIQGGEEKGEKKKKKRRSQRTPFQ